MLSQIDQSLLPRITANDAMTTSVNLLNGYMSSLDIIYENTFTLEKKPNTNIAICQKPKAQLQQEILTARDAEQAPLATVSQKRSDNQTITDALQTGKLQIQSVPQDDLASLTLSFEAIKDKLDPTAATDLRTASQTERDQIQLRVGQNLNLFNQQINDCYQ